MRAKDEKKEKKNPLLSPHLIATFKKKKETIGLLFKTLKGQNQSMV